MMNRKALFIGENTGSFIFKSIQNTVKEIDLDADYVAANVKEISSVIDKYDMIFLYGGEYIDESMEMVVYLKDYCLEKEKKISIIGFSEEIARLKKTFPEPLIFSTYERPINVKELVGRIKEDMEKEAVEDNKKHILVVDDSGTMLRTVKSWLSGKYKVSIASSAAMAINFLATNKPDLILLDYEMPICSGPQFLEMIHAEPATSGIPVIFLTSKGDLDSVKQVLKLKPEGYLLKTMKQDEIISYVNDFFEKQKTLA
ncbi:MAG: response regulator [Eubacteriales bacterium]|nr:response regulator [Eubacteriales bacterium]